MKPGDDIWFSAAQLALLGGARVIDFPRHEKSAREKARRLGWKLREVQCKGGKRGYRVEFLPPEDILLEIRSFLQKNHGFLDQPGKTESALKPYPVSRTASLITGEEEHSGLKIEDHAPPDFSLDDFAPVAGYGVQSGAGHGTVIDSGQGMSILVFKKEWLRKSLGVNEKHLALISVKGDGMAPTLKGDDLILIDTSKGRIEDDSIYVLQFNGDLIVKRVQRLLNGTVIIKSDNPAYGQEELDAPAAQTLKVLGRVVWYGRKI